MDAAKPEVIEITIKLRLRKVGDKIVSTVPEVETETVSVPQAVEPIPMLLYCPECRGRHIDKGAFATRVHHTHSCQTCGHTWRPAIVPTVGVQFLPGFKDE